MKFNHKYAARWVLASCAAILTFSLSLHAQVELPEIGEPADRALSPLEEKRIGAEALRQLRSHNYVLEDLEVTTYIRDIGRRLVSQTDAEPANFRFFIINDGRINAFALPGGYVGINTGLFLSTRNENELAGVLAHEVAHVTQRHIARQIDATAGMGLVTMAAVILAILAGGGDGDLAEAALAIGLSSNVQRQINYTRAHETEADRIGIHTLARSGYDPNGMVSFFQLMEERAKLYGDGPPEILRTHPVNLTRVTEARTRAAQYKSLGVQDQKQYRLMQARLRVITEPQRGEALNYYRKRLGAEDRSQVDEYGYGLALLRNGQYPEAAKVFDKLTAAQPRQIHYLLASAETSYHNRQHQQALQQYQQARTLFPNYLPLVHDYAYVLLEDGQPAQARRIILETPNALSGEAPELLRLLANASRDQGHYPEAHFRMAEYHYLNGEIEYAINQLEAALKLPELGKTDEARIRARLERYEKEAPKKRRGL